MNGNELTYNKEKLPGSQKIKCPFCSTNITYFVPGQTINIGCQKCISLFQIHQGKTKKLKRFKINRRPIIPIGTECVFNEVNYRVTGYKYCKEHNLSYYWNEYVLFNPIYGYAYLNEYSGHWTFLVETNNYPRNPGNKFRFDGNKYQIFHAYKSHTVFAVGEFSDEMTSVYKPHCIEYISPPYIMVQEKYRNELSWFFGTYYSASKIQKIFKLKNLPPQVGVASNQPLLFSFSREAFKKIRNISLGLLLITQLLFLIFSDGSRISSKTYEIPDSLYTAGSTPVIISDPMEIKGSLLGTVNLEFELYSPVDNSWLATYVTLINEKTGEQFSFEHGVEYYYGYTGGESWSEGSKRDSKIISKIPTGTYYMSIIPFKNDRGVSPGYFQLAVYRDVTLWSNFFISLLLMLVFPIGMYLYVQVFEGKRWINSEFNE